MTVFVLTRLLVLSCLWMAISRGQSSSSCGSDQERSDLAGIVGELFDAVEDGLQSGDSSDHDDWYLSYASTDIYVSLKGFPGQEGKEYNSREAVLDESTGVWAQLSGGEVAQGINEISMSAAEDLEFRCSADENGNSIITLYTRVGKSGAVEAGTFAILTYYQFDFLDDSGEFSCIAIKEIDEIPAPQTLSLF